MQSLPVKTNTEQSCKIIFSPKVFGKPTKSRKEDPSMFQILAWGTQGFEKHSFKKNQKFQEPTQVYLNMIGKTPWTSEAQQNYLNYSSQVIDANPNIFHKIQNYIEERLPYQTKVKKQYDKKQKQTIEHSKQNCKYNPQNYSQPKSGSKRMLSPQQQPIKTNETSKLVKKSKNTIQNKKDLRPKTAINTSQVQNNNQKKHPTAKDQQFNVQDSVDQQKLIEHFKQTTRWIPNSSFTTYFGKPPFQNYGRGNTKPIDGGLIYGTYLYSHNVHPHRGKNNPKHLQSYPVALTKAKSQGTLVPTYPRTKPQQKLTNKSQVQDHMGKIQPQPNVFSQSLEITSPNLREMQKFGGKKDKTWKQQNRY